MLKFRKLSTTVRGLCNLQFNCFKGCKWSKMIRPTSTCCLFHPPYYPSICSFSRLCLCNGTTPWISRGLTLRLPVMTGGSGAGYPNPLYRHYYAKVLYNRGDPLYFSRPLYILPRLLPPEILFSVSHDVVYIYLSLETRRCIYFYASVTPSSYWSFADFPVGHTALRREYRCRRKLESMISGSILSVC